MTPVAIFGANPIMVGTCFVKSSLASLEDNDSGVLLVEALDANCTTRHALKVSIT